MYIEKKSVSFQQLPGTLAPLSQQLDEVKPRKPEFYFFSYWTKVPPGAAWGKVNQVTIGVIGDNIISVTKCMELFLLDAVLGKDLLGSLAILLLPRRVVCQHFVWNPLVSYWDLGFNRHIPFCPAAQKRKEQTLVLCMSWTLLGFLRKLELREIVLWWGNNASLPGCIFFLLYQYWHN